LKNAALRMRGSKGLLMLVVPLLILLSSVWIILLGAGIWVPIEYRMPGFPPDSYGFSLEDRIFWSAVDIDFLLGDEPISFFDDIRLESGAPMHNERELVHMQDVKSLIDLTRWVWAAALLLSLFLTYILARAAGRAAAGAAWRSAARWTAILMLLIGAGLVVGFGVLFVGFHRLFFEGSTWIFPLSDTFIRLYPERFWRDTFALVAIISLCLTGIVYALGRVVERRS
jgi:integral membrane protein (TIGR01906 family)